jgi:glucose/arabinose dehydrogenase
MKKNFIILFVISLLIFTGQLNYNCTAQILIGETQIDTSSVATGLDTPWEILWGQDNHIWITERTGKISRLNSETGNLQLLHTIADVHEESESGLLGMALHPDFSDTPYVYLVYNYLDGSIKERVIRYTYNGTGLISPLTLLENIGGAGNHNGSRIIIDENYKLFVTTGDATNTSSAQNLSSLSGKILRMNLDGSIPADNPASDSYLWTWGHRNPQGLVIASNGEMYSSEHGPNNDDELNLIVKGNNYGWPNVHGFCDLSTEIDFCENNNITEPLQAWTPTLAVAGIDYYNSDSIPEWKQNILMVSLKGERLVSMKLSADGLSIDNSSEWFKEWFGRLRDICIAPDGRVFISTSNRDGRGSPSAGDDRIVQIRAHQDNVIPSGINKTNRSNVFSVYPNPMNQSAEIRLINENDDAKLLIYNMSGNILFEDFITDGYYQLNRGIIPSGIYIVKVTGATATGNLPLIIN